ncbi:MAG: transposase [Planctomycetaceae bacterium]|nr:transposase [Planctomycetaceae bacterium]
MARIPDAVQTLFVSFSKDFAPSVWQRFSSLLTAAVMVRGRRTVWRLIRWSGDRPSGHFSSYHRVFSHRRWSSHQHLVHRWGHKWVVLALRIQVAGASRTWALPMLVALYRTPEESLKAGGVHKTPPQLMRGLLAIWMRWFPQRKTVFAGDGGFASHKLAAFASRHRNRLTLVSKFPPDVVLHDPPPHRMPGQNGRPRVVGTRLPSPRDVVVSHKHGKRLTVKWYGG